MPVHVVTAKRKSGDTTKITLLLALDYLGDIPAAVSSAIAWSTAENREALALASRPRFNPMPAMII